MGYKVLNILGQLGRPAVPDSWALVPQNVHALPTNKTSFGMNGDRTKSRLPTAELIFL